MYKEAPPDDEEDFGTVYGGANRYKTKPVLPQIKLGGYLYFNKIPKNIGAPIADFNYIRPARPMAMVTDYTIKKASAGGAGGGGGGGGGDKVVVSEDKVRYEATEAGVDGQALAFPPSLPAVGNAVRMEGDVAVVADSTDEGYEVS